MSNPQTYGSGFPPPRASSAVWYCNGCRRMNPGRRYQCQ
ncbi:unnamed protein product, partial [Rotaria sordida]